MSNAVSSLESSGIRLPHEAVPQSLRPYVLEVYEEIYPAFQEPLTLLVSPGLIPTLNATLRGRAWITVNAEASFWMPSLLLTGPQPVPYSATCHGTVHRFYVTFHAAGPLALLGARRYWRGSPGAPPSMAELVRPDLEPRARAFESDLLAASDFEARTAVTVSFLLDALAGAPEADLKAAAFLQQAADEIERAHGGLRDEALARGLGVSPSTLRRRFAVLGIPAKRFADIVRFRHAHALLNSTPGATWADAVRRFGYTDQSHLVRARRARPHHDPTRSSSW